MSSLAIIQPQGIDRARLDLWKKTVARGASDLEFETFVQAAQRSGLDPVLKQIYAVFRGAGDKRTMTIQVGIDGYRLMADRTGSYAGSDDAVYEEGEPVNGKPRPAKATVTVWRIVGGVRCPFTASARWSEYASDTGLWGRMPYLMLGKCAEALALRKAFPAELSGIYTREEMDQAAHDGPVIDGATGEIINEAPVSRAVSRPTVVTEIDPRAEAWSNYQKAIKIALANGFTAPVPDEDATLETINLLGARIKQILQLAKSLGWMNARARWLANGADADDLMINIESERFTANQEAFLKEAMESYDLIYPTKKEA